MEKTKNSALWIETGYKLFAEEGFEGIQIERLARILKLNKSGFYHYFGDIEGFREALADLHRKSADMYLDELKSIQSIDPEYFQLVVRFKIPIMFQMQSIRNKRNTEFYNMAQLIDVKESEILKFLWCNFLGINERSALAMRYFSILRDMFYTRVSVDNFEFAFVRNLFTEARTIMRQLAVSDHAIEPAGTGA